MLSRSGPQRSPYLQAVAQDNSLPIDPRVAELWLQDIERHTRWVARPLLQLFFATLLHVVWALKRLPLPQFRAHKFLQRTICWFCVYFVSPEANQLILRHFAVESNILNFLRDNSDSAHPTPLMLYPKSIDEMMVHTFVLHDQELFRMMRDLGQWKKVTAPKLRSQFDWSNWREIEIDPSVSEKRWTRVLDFETSHALFMCLFCFLLTAEEYRDAINGFNLDQSIAIRIGQIVNDPTLVELAFNKYPLYLLGPWNLGQRFLMHGFFTEHLHARLEELRP